MRPVGSGPFRLVSYDTARVVMERNPNFRQEPVDLAAEGYDPATQKFSGVEAIQGRSPPFVDRLEFNFINESSASWTFLHQGRRVQLTVLPIEQVDRVLATKRPVTLRPEYAARYHIYAGLEAGFVSTAFNMDFPELRLQHGSGARAAEQGPALRDHQGLRLGGPQRQLVLRPWRGTFPGSSCRRVRSSIRSCPGTASPATWPAPASCSGTTAGRPRTCPRIVYGTTAGTTERLIFEQFRAWMRDIGFPREKVVQKTYANFGDISRAWKRNQLPLVSKGWGLDYPDAENTLQLFYGPNALAGLQRRQLEESGVSTGSTTRPRSCSPRRNARALYRRMNQIVIDDCVAITGLSRTRIYLWHKDVIAIPDREILGGFWLKYVDVVPAGQPARRPAAKGT